jgi:RsiW-degrading membrane proteinase PrsW (M82 family)
MTRILVGLLLGVLPLALLLWLWRRVDQDRQLSRRLVLAMAAGGGGVALAAFFVERLVLGWSGLSFDAAEAGIGGALLATFLLAGPLEEGAKLLVILPLNSPTTIGNSKSGLFYAVAVGAGFAAVESAALAISAPLSALGVLRIALAEPAHVFFTGAWGYALGSGRGMRGRWFSLTWLCAMLLHALYDHIVFGRGPGLLVFTAPMLLFMALGAWAAFRDVADASGRAVRRSRLPEPPSLREMGRVLRRTERPLMIHWIAIGSLVTLGVMIVALAGAIYVGHRMGIDFASADEADVRSSGPLVLLGSFLLAAFPVAGYLIARASAAESVLEPAMATAVAIAAIVLLMSLTAPVAVVFVLAVAPIAFGLACAGAWFGLER